MKALQKVTEGIPLVPGPCVRALGLLVWTLFLGIPALAQVEGEQVIDGQAIFERSDNQTLIHTSDQAIIEYSRFNIAPDELVRFIQPGATSRVLNRVLDADPSLIEGTLLANGIVYIVNPAGVYFAHGSLVDAGAIFAAAGSISNADFLAGIDRFTSLTGGVIQNGTLKADQIVLAGKHVSNTGDLLAPEGLVMLAAGNELILGEREGHIMVKIHPSGVQSGTPDEPGVENTGTIEAANGNVILSAGDLYAMAIRQSGRIHAREIEIEGQGKGVVEAGGSLRAVEGAHGGRVEVTGEKVAVTGSIDASGDLGGGTILVGGDFQGKGELANAEHTLVLPEAMLNADAGTSGDGGRIVVWSDESTRYLGNASARGGALSGDGGFVEVSGKQSLGFHGGMDLSAPNGEGGTLLLDPANIEISTNADSNTAGFTPPGDLTEAFADDTGLDSVFDVTTGTGSFAGIADGATIELQATNDINVLNDFDIATSTGNSNVSLVLRSGNDINLSGVVTADGTGTLTLSADDNTPDGVGDITIANTGGLATANQAISLESNDISIDPAATIDAGTGTVTLLASDGGSMGLGDTAGGYTLSGSELQRITAGNLVMGDTTNNSITVDNISATNSNGISGTVTLNATKASQSVAFSNNASTFNALAVNAGTGGVTVGQALTTDTGAMALSAGTGTMDLNADLTAATGLTLSDAGTVDLAAGVDLTAQNGNLSASTGVTGIDLSGGSVSNVISADGGDIDLAAISDSGTPALLSITGQQSITLAGVDIQNQLSVTADNDNNTSSATLTANGAIQTAAGPIILSTGSDSNDTMDLNADVTAGTNLTLQQAQKIDLAANVDLTAQNGSLTVNTGVTGIDLSGTGGTNLFTADGGDITLAPISDTGTPNTVTISGQQNVTLNGVNVAGILNANADDNGTGSGNISLSTGALQTANQAINLSANDIAISAGTTVNAGSETVTLLVSDNGSMGLGDTAGNLTLDGAELQRITAGNFVMGDSTNDTITVDNITAANSNNISGTVTLNATKASQSVLFSNNTSTFNALAANAGTGGVVVDQALTTDSGSIAISGGTGTVDLNADVTSAGALTVTNASSLDLTTNVDLTAQGGNLTATSGVTGIDLSGSAGENIFTTDGGDIALAAITDSGTPTTLTISGEQGVTLSGADVQCAVNVTADDNGSGTGDLTLSTGALQTANKAIALTANDITINSGATVDAGTQTVTLLTSDGGSMGLGDTAGNFTLDGAELQRITAANLVMGDATNDSITVDNITDVNSNNISGTVTLNATKSGQGVTFANAESIFNAITINAGTGGVAVGQALTTDTAAIAINGGTGLIDVNADITASTALTITNAGSVDLAANADLKAQNGNLTATSGVSGINLSGATGTNLITSNGGDISLPAIADTGTPLRLNITGRQDVTLAQVNIENLLTVTADDDNNTPGATLTLNGTVQTAADSIQLSTGSDANDTIDINADVTAGTSMLIQKAMEVDMATNVDLTAQNGDLAALTAITNIDLSGSGGTNLFTADGGDISLANIVDTGTPGTVTISGRQGVALNGSNIQCPLNITADDNGDGTGDITVTSGSLQTANQAINLTGNDININTAASINAGTETVTLLVSDGGSIGLGDTSGNMTLTGAELQRITAGNMIIGDASNNSITVDNITDANSDNISGTVTLNATQSGRNITFTNTASTFNTLTANAGTGGIVLNQALSTDTGALTLNGGTGTMDLNADATSATALTVTNAGSLDMATNVDLTAQNGNLTATSGVTGIALSGTGGTNLFTADGGDIALAPITDSGTPATITISGQQNVTLNGADVQCAVNVSADDNGSGTGDLTLSTGALQTSNQAINLTANDVTINSGATVNAGTETVTLLVSDAGSMGLGDTTGNLTLDAAELQRITAGNFVMGDSTNDTITVDNITAANSNNISGTVTLNATKSGQGVAFSNNASTFNALTVNAGTGGVVVGQVLTTDTGAMALNGGTGTVDVNADVTSATSLTVTNAGSLDLAASTDLTAQNGNLTATSGVSGINLSGASGTNIITADGGDISLAAIADTGTPALLNITGQQNVTLTGVNIRNQLTATADDDNDTASATLAVNGVVQTTAGAITLSGGTDGDDTIDINADVTSGTALSLQQAQEVDLAANTDLTAQNGNLTASTGVTGIDLSGASGTNLITADGGDINVAAITDSGTPAVLNITGQQSVTLAGVDIQNQLTATADDDNDTSSATLTLNGTTQSAAGSITLSGGTDTNDTIDVNGDVTAATSLTLQQAQEIDLAVNVDLNAQNGNLAASTGVTGIDLSGTGGANIFTADGGDITLASISDSGTPGSVTVTGRQNVTLNGADVQCALNITSDDNASGTGDITLSSGALQTADQAITLTGNDLTINSGATVDAGTGTVTLLVSDAGSMGLGDTSGNFTVSGAELQRITAGNLVMGNASNNSITVDNITAANSNNISGTVTLNATKSGQSVAFSNNASTFNTLAVNAGTGGVTVGQALTTDTGALAIDGGTGTVDVNGDVTAATGLTISNTGSLDLAANADLTAQNGALAANTGVTGINLSGASGTNLITADGGDITLAAISDTGTPAQLTISGQQAVSLAGVNIQNNLSVTADDDNNSFNSSPESRSVTLSSSGALQSAAGSITLSGGTDGNDTIDLNADVTAGTSLTIQQAQEIDLAAGVDLIAQNGNLTASTGVTGIDLSGASGTNLITADGGDISLAAISDSGTPALLNITGQKSVTLGGVNIQNQLTATADDNNDTSSATLTLNGSTTTAAGSITLTGGSDTNDTIDINGDVTSGSSLTLTQAQTVDLAAGVDLTAQSGNLSVATSVTGIDLSGASGTNRITADNGNITVAPIADTGTPAALEISGQQNVTVSTVNIENQLSLTADDDNNTPGSLLTINGNLDTNAGSITLSGGSDGNDTIDINADITAGTALTVQNAQSVDLSATADMAAGGGDLGISTGVSGINFSGASGTNRFTADGGDITLVALADTGSPDAVVISGEQNVTLGTVDLQNQISVTTDDDNDTAGAVMMLNGALDTAAGAITLSGGSDGDDTIDVNYDLTGGTSLTVANARTVDLAQGVDLTAENGDVTASGGITGINLSGASGTNRITADLGSVDVGALSDTGTPDTLQIVAGDDITLDSVNIANGLDVDLDQNLGGATLTTGAIEADTIRADGTGTDDTMNFNGTVVSRSGDITIDTAGTVSVLGAMTSASAIGITAGSISLNGAASNGAQQYTGSTNLAGTFNTNGNGFTVTGNTTVTGDAAVNTTGGGVHFAGTIDDDAAAARRNLDIDADAGTLYFDGDIGADEQLGRFSALASGHVIFSGSAETQHVDAMEIVLGEDLASVPNVATIYRQNQGDLDIDCRTFTMGDKQKMTVVGSIQLDNGAGGNASSARLSDMNALNDITIFADSIVLKTREPGTVLNYNGNTQADRGVDMVAGGRLYFSSEVVPSGSGPAPRLGDDDGEVPGSGNLVVQALPFGLTSDLFYGPSNQTLDFLPEGPSKTNLAELVARETTDQWIQYIPQTRRMERAAPAGYSESFEEVITLLSGNARYLNNLSPAEMQAACLLVKRIKEKYRGLFGSQPLNAPEGKRAFPDRQEEIRKRINDAKNAYQEMMGHSTFDPVAFRSFLTGQDSPARGSIESLQEILQMILDLDLPPFSRQQASYALLVPFTPKELSVRQLESAILPLAR